MPGKPGFYLLLACMRHIELNPVRAGMVTHPARRFAYRELFRHAMYPALIHGIRTTVQTGTPSENGRFREQIEQTLRFRVGQPRRGKPGKAGKGY